jgi:hypothetical protein
MVICVLLFYVCVYVCVGIGALRRADLLSKESYRLCIGVGKLKRRPRRNKRAVEPKEEEERRSLINLLFRVFISLGSIRYVGNLLSYQPRVVDDDECGAVGGMFGKGNRSTRRKLVPVPFYPPQIPHDLTWTAAVASRRLNGLVTLSNEMIKEL